MRANSVHAHGVCDLLAEGTDGPYSDLIPIRHACQFRRIELEVLRTCVLGRPIATFGCISERDVEPQMLLGRETGVRWHGPRVAQEKVAKTCCEYIKIVLLSCEPPKTGRLYAACSTSSCLFRPSSAALSVDQVASRRNLGLQARARGRGDGVGV